MQFRCTGTNHATGARMTLEVEAGAKAGAEREARNRGMDVQHVEPIVEGPPTEHQGSRRRGEEDPQERNWAIRGIVGLAIVALAAAVWFYFSR